MIIANYGKLFLDYFNKKRKENGENEMTPKQFFIEELYPILIKGFLQPLIFVPNSKWNNPSVVGNRKKILNNNQYDNSIDKFIDDVEEGRKESSFFVKGVGHRDLLASFNEALDINYDYNKDNAYYSWIGHGLAIQLQNKLLFLFNDGELLYNIYIGWKKCRDIINKQHNINSIYTNTIINKWNGQWLNYLHNNEIKYTKNEFNPFEYDYEIYKKKRNINPVSWIELFFNMAKHTSKRYGELYSYVYKLDNQGDTTFEYVSINLDEFNSFKKYCNNNFFETNEKIKNSEIKSFYNSNTISLEKLCEFKSIGFYSLKPKLLYSLYDNKIKEIFKTNDKSLKILKIYLKMKYSKEFTTKAIQFADFLYRFKLNEKTKAKGKYIVDNVRKTKNLKNLQEKIGEMLEMIGSNDSEDGKFLIDLYEYLHSNESIDIFEFLNYVNVKFLAKENEYE
jgi:hypothetical protein